MLSTLCQHFNMVGEHPFQRRAWYGIRMNCGVRSNLRRQFWSAESGAASCYQEGQWVQVLDEAAIRATLDARSRLKGLQFLDYQWAFCGGVFRVQKVMRRIVDDSGFFRPVSRTILLEGVDCGGLSGTTGCGRRCPIMFRDEWVRPAHGHGPQVFPREIIENEKAESSRYKRVRSAAQIRATLDWQGKRDGLMFMPEMARWAGMRFPVAKTVRSVFECNQLTATPAPLYILEGLQCSGDVLGRKAPCDRRCSILWHPDWLSDDA